MSDLVIRPASLHDVASIAALILMGRSDQPATREEAELEAQHPAYATAFATVKADPNSFLYVGARKGRVVATYQLTLIPGIAERGRMRAKIESVHVDPDCRGQGLGKQLIAHAVDECRRHHVGLVELSSNKVRLDAHRFYRTLGFAQSHEGFKLALEVDMA